MNQFNRRDFLKTASAATLSALAAGYARPIFAAEPEEKITPTADCVIVLWMGGGPSHLDIWDLKPDSEKNGGSFKPIDTSASGVQTLCPHCARNADSRLMSPLKVSCNVVGNPRLSRIIRTMHRTMNVVIPPMRFAVRYVFHRGSFSCSRRQCRTIPNCDNVSAVNTPMT